MFRKFLTCALAWWLLVSPVLAADAIFWEDSPSQTLYVRIRTSSTASIAVALTEGSSNAVGYYTVSEAALVSAGLTLAGDYPFKIFVGTPSTSAADPQIGKGTLPWTGSVVRDSRGDIDAIRDITDTFDDFSDTTPAVSGPPDIGYGLLSGTLNRIVFLGDSVTQNMQSSISLWMTRAGIKGYGSAADWYSGGTQSGVFTASAHTADFGDFTEGGGRWGSVAFGSGTSDASATSTTNRMLELARLGPETSVNENVEAEWDSAQQRWVLGYDWMTTQLASGDLKVRFMIRKHSNGTTVANEYFVVKNNSTVIATSPYVSTYAADETFEWVEATIPQGTSTPFTGLNVEVRFKESTAAENGKVSYWSARGEVYDPNATTGSLVHVFGQGGLTVDNYHNGLNWSDASMGLFKAMQPDVFVIALGLNNSSGGSGNDGVPATFAADLDLLVDRLRGFCPNCKIIFWGLHGRSADNPLYGGGGVEPYFTEGMYIAQQATPNSAFINTCKLLPNGRVLAGPYPYFFQFTNFPNGTYIYIGTVVENGGNLYAARTTHAKTSTVPGSDATNWALLGAYTAFNMRHPKSTDLNPMFYDGLHPTLHGGYLLMQSFTDGLQLLRYKNGGAVIAQSVRAEMEPELGQVSSIYGKLPAGSLNIAGAGTLADNLDEVWTTGTRTLSSGANIVLAKGTGITGFNDIAAGDVWGVTVRTLSSGANIVLAKGTGVTGFNDITAASVWGVETRTLSSGANIVLAKDTGVTGFNDITAASVWGVETRTLSSGANIVLAKDTGVTGFNDVSSGDVQTAAQSAVNALGLSTFNPSTDLVKLKLDYAVPVSNAPNTIGDCLNVARAMGAGRMVIDPTTRTMRLYSADGTTVVGTLLIGPNLTTPYTRTPQ